MKYIIIIAAIVSIGSIIAGFLFELPYAQKLIGGGVVGLFFVVFPLFIYHRWKDKNFKDYMLTNESLERMKQNAKEKKERN